MKLYFREDDEERCYPKKRIKEDMKEEGISELKIFEAKRATDKEYFYCKFFHDTGEVRQSCGKICPEYKPRNGKNGRCCYSNNCYERTNKMITLKVKL